MRYYTIIAKKDNSLDTMIVLEDFKKPYPEGYRHVKTIRAQNFTEAKERLINKGGARE